MKLSLKLLLLSVAVGLSSMTYAADDPKVLEAEHKLLEAEHKAAEADHHAAFKNGKIDHAVHHEHKAREAALNAHKGKKHKTLAEVRAAREDIKKHHTHVRHHVSTSKGLCHKDVHDATKALGDDHAAHNDVIKDHPEHAKAHDEARAKHATRVAHLNKGGHTHAECESIHAGVKASHKNHHTRHGHGKTHAATKKPVAGGCHNDVHLAAKALGDDHAAHDAVIKAHPEHAKAHADARTKHATRMAHLNKGGHTKEECDKILASIKDSHKNHAVRHGHGKTLAATKPA